MQSWRRWLDEDLSSHPYRWLRLDLVPPLPYLVCPHQIPGGSEVLVQSALRNAHFWKA